MQSFNREDYIHKLEKDNKELKQMYLGENYEKAKLVGQLNKAKELIKDFLSLGIFGIFKGTTAEEIVDKAEDFLKENTAYERIQKAKYNYID